MKKKGFTLIELIVVMAIIGILVLLASPKYKEYTKDAKLTRIKINIKELEQASQKYYMKYDDWPRLIDEPYSSKQIEDFGKEILDKTGAVVTLEPDGKYYDIDFAKIDNYVNLPDDNVNYILQNPEGKVFFIEGITKEAKERIPENINDNEEPEKPDNPENPSEPVIFHGLDPEAFDKDSTTFSYKTGTITWDGNLDNKVVHLDIAGFDSWSGTDYPATFRIYNASNQIMNFIDLTDYKEVNNISTIPRVTKEILIPEGAVKFEITSGVSNVYIYDVYIVE